MIHAEFKDKPVNGLGCQSRFNQRNEFVKAARGQLTGLAHAGKAFRAVKFYMAIVLVWRCNGVDVINQLFSSQTWFVDRDHAVKANFLRAYVAPDSHGFNAAGNCPVKCFCIIAIEIAADFQPVTIGSLNKINHNTTIASFYHISQFLEMFGAAAGFTVGKLCQIFLPDEMDILHLDIGWRAFRVCEHQVYA